MSHVKLANSILKRLTRGVGYGALTGATAGAGLGRLASQGIIQDAKNLQNKIQLKQFLPQGVDDSLAYANYGVGGLAKGGLSDSMYDTVSALRNSGDTMGLAKLLEQNADYLSPEIMATMMMPMTAGGAGLGLGIGALMRRGSKNLRR